MAQISPQGYVYGEEPYSDHPFWSDDPLVQTELTASASVDDTTGEPGVEVTRTEYVEPNKRVNFNFAFTGLKGQDGQDGSDGVTPEVTATAQVDALSGTPSVQVTRTGPDANPNFNFAFSGLKGEQGPQGEPGPQGPAGGSPEGYIDSWDSTLDQHSGNITGMRFVDHRNASASDRYRASGQVTVKDNNDNSYSMDFGIVPPGGTAGQVLKKMGSSNFLASWESLGIDYDVIPLEDCLDGPSYSNPKIAVKKGDIVILKQDLDSSQLQTVLDNATILMCQAKQTNATYLTRAAQAYSPVSIRTFCMAPIVIDRDVTNSVGNFNSIFYMELDFGSSAPIRYVPVTGFVNLYIDNRYDPEVEYTEQSSCYFICNEDCMIDGSYGGAREINGLCYHKVSFGGDFRDLDANYNNMLYVVRPKVV